MDHASRFAASLLRASARAYAAAVVQRLGEEQPELLGRQWPATFASPEADTEVRLLHLAVAVAVDEPLLLERALHWYRVALAHRGVPDGYLAANLDAIAAVLAVELPEPARAPVARHLARARDQLASAPAALRSHLETPAPLLECAQRFLLAVLEGRADDANALVRAALDAGASIEEVHDHVLCKVQAETGRMWQMAEIPIADEHFGTLVIERVLGLLQDRIPPPPTGAPRVLAMAVRGNLHAFGIRVVAQRLRLAGFAVHDLGADMPPGDLPFLFADRRFDLVALSASLVLHVTAAAEAVAELRSCLGAACPPILVGGEPFAVAPRLWRAIGADAGAADAASAVAAARALVSAPEHR